jgi:catechol 2,3-dioxygenase-like lactoylglutathione lyase family enzyme
MGITRFEVCIVSADRQLVDFLVDVFALNEFPPLDTPAGTLHRLDSPGAVIKVMVPNDAPQPTDMKPFLAVAGIRYLSMWVSDLDRVIERCAVRGGTILVEPFEYEPATRLAVITDPDGNTYEVIEARTA